MSLDKSNRKKPGKDISKEKSCSKMISNNHNQPCGKGSIRIKYIYIYKINKVEQNETNNVKYTKIE